jgi:hypothetical protein
VNLYDRHCTATRQNRSIRIACSIQQAELEGWPVNRVSSQGRSRGFPVADATVNGRSGRGATYSARTDALGQFRIDKLVGNDQIIVMTVSAGTRSGQSKPIVAGTTDARIVHTSAAARASGPRANAPAPARETRGAP